MNLGLPRPPEPPHDPRSIMLNGAIGFRQRPPAAGLPAAIEPDCCALVLPRVPAVLRDLAEPTGSLGGLRPPSNVALGPDGGIYLLDRTKVELKRFDPCECTFVKVPCLGGIGAGARQLSNPGDITIACGNLYVCDTGLEAATPAEQCEIQATLDAKIRAENHRVSVFALKGFVLRGHLLPPPDKRPWRPVSIAVDSLGRVWVIDATGRIHRFAPSGCWENAWPIPATDHLAIDCRDRLYLTDDGPPRSLTVLDGDARPVPDPPKRPEDVRASLPHLPFHVDQLGRLWLEPCCDPCRVRKVDPRSDLVFDADGNSVEIKAAPPGPIYEKQATYRSEVLDSRIAQCVWHRVVLFGSLPSGTRARVRVFTADQVLRDAELNAPPASERWRECAIADELDEGGRWDCLVRSEPGRYLWLELVLEGNGSATPSICAIVVEFPRISLRRFLPAVFGMEAVSADFTDRFLALFDTTLRSIERQIDQIAHLFDPGSAPATTADPRQQDFLSWLGGWIGVALDRNWDVGMRRRFLKHAGALFDRRGTVSGLREQLRILLDLDRHLPCEIDLRDCGRCIPDPRNCRPDPEPVHPEPPPLVLEHYCLRRWLRVGAGRLSDDAVVWGERLFGRTRLCAHGQLGVTRLDTSPDPARDPFLVHANQFSVFVPARYGATDRGRRALDNLLKSEAPAGTYGYLHLVEPRFRIGIQSLLGFDSVVAAVPQGVTLGATPLGAASILTAPPHLEGGPAIVLDKDGRVGTTTLLG
jgi:phage tail-like protein